jgi:hypothetical protein
MESEKYFTSLVFELHLYYISYLPLCFVRCHYASTLNNSQNEKRKRKKHYMNVTMGIYENVTTASCIFFCGPHSKYLKRLGRGGHVELGKSKE